MNAFGSDFLEAVEIPVIHGGSISAGTLNLRNIVDVDCAIVVLSEY